MLSISVIIPVYNVEQYISRCIKSIIDQENCGANLECIIVNDCSPDNSLEIIHSIINKYKGNIDFCFLEHKYNKGLSAARNTGIDAAQGDYVLFVDSDDWLPANSISCLVEKLFHNPDADMIAGNSHYTINDEEHPFVASEKIYNNSYQLNKDLFNYRNINCSAWNKLIKTDIAKKHKFKEGIIYEDTLWTYTIYKEFRKAIIIPDITYIYENDHPLSIINSTNKTEENASKYLYSISIIGNYIIDKPYWDLYADSHIYFLGFYIRALRLKHELKINNKESRMLMQLRRRLVLQTFKDGRWFLAFFFFILSYPPVFCIFNIGWFRHHYNSIEKAGRRTALFLEKFHKHNRN